MKRKKTADRLLSLLLALTLALSPLAGTVRADELDASEALTAPDSSEELTAASVPEEYDEDDGESSPDEFDNGEQEQIAEPDASLSAGEEDSQEELPAPPSPDDAVQDPEPEQPENSAGHLEVDSARDLADFLTEQWQEDYFQEAVVDTRKNQVIVDGQASSVEEVFGAEADEKAILDSPRSAEAYFEDTAYETEALGGGKVSVTAPWQTCRIVVNASSLPEDYGARTVVEYPSYHQFVLQFGDEEATKTAYEALSGRYSCYVDQVYTADNLIQETETWGCDAMAFRTPREGGVFSDQEPIQVAIIDSGCCKDNSFFSGRSRSFSAASKSFPDDDGPFVDALSGCHGTHVAGIVHTCTPDNVELMILRIFSVHSSQTSLLLADTALKYALENGADVINFSLGVQGSSTSQLNSLDSVLSTARSLGVPVVCSAGNQSQDVNTNYPACNEDTIAVSAVNRSKQFAYTYSENPDETNFGTGGTGSSYGEGIDFCAPGVNIVSASQTGVVTKNGTSMAAPHITAALAWLCLEDPSASWNTLYNRLKELCEDLGTEGRDELYGWGLPQLSSLGTASGSHVHNWNTVVTPPTCTSEGFTTYTCTEPGCTEVRVWNYVGPTHDFDDQGECTVCHKMLDNRCGEGLTWSYNSATETLTVTGSGASDSDGDGVSAEDGDTAPCLTEEPWTDLYPKQFIRRVVLREVPALGDGLFRGYENLESVDLGSALTRLGRQSFYGCTSLNILILPSSLTQIGDGSFCACTALHRIASNSSSFTVANGCLLYDKGKTRLIACAGAWSGGSLTLPATITQVGPHACQGVSGLTTLILPTGLTVLGEESFAQCANLTQIYARSDISSLGSKAFDGVTATVSVSEGCTGWENHAALGDNLIWESYPGNLGESGPWSMELNSYTWSYKGEARYPGVILKCGDIEVRNYKMNGVAPNHSDYFSYRYTNNLEPGQNTASVTITGKGIYYGTRTKSFSILLTTPTVLPSQNSTGGVVVNWSRNPAEGEAEYEDVTFQVMRREVGETSWTKLDTSTQTTCTDTSALSGHRYDYTVYLLNRDLKVASRYKDTDAGRILRLASPLMTSATLQDNGAVSVAWNSVDGAVSYEVLNQDDSGNWQILAENVTGTSWTDTAPVVGAANWYTVRAIAEDGTASACTAGLSASVLAAPSLTSLSFEGAGIRLGWSAVNGAAAYRAYCKAGTGTWQSVGMTSSTSLLVTTSNGHTPLSSGTTYTFALRCVSANGSVNESAWSNAGKSLRYLTAPTLCSAVNKGSGVQLLWTGSRGAARYRVVCKQGSGAWKTVGSTTATSALIQTSDGKTALKTGKTYRFTVCCVSADGKTLTSAWNSTGKTLVYVRAPTLSSVKNVKKQKLTASWKKVSGASGYQLQIALNKGFTSGKKTVTLKGAGSVSKTLSKLKKKKTYWVRVRCYRKAGSKTYWSGWSTVKKLTIKK